jgi:hypothetical protein
LKAWLLCRMAQADLLCTNIGRFTMIAATAWWPPVLAGLGGALIVGVVSYLVARGERDAASQHQRLQLKHDRELRAGETAAAAVRLKHQLDHDRLMRDQTHIRVVLGPIAGKLADESAIAPLVRAVTNMPTPSDIASRAQYVGDECIAAYKRAGELYTDAVTLMILLGEDEPIVSALGNVAEGLKGRQPRSASGLKDRSTTQVLMSFWRELEPSARTRN